MSEFIGLIGTSCVGKTSVIKSAKATYGNVPAVAVLDEEARKYFQANPDITDRFSATVQGKLMGLIINASQRALEGSSRVVVSDRAPICAPIYVAASGDHEGAEELFARIESITARQRLLLLDPAGVPYQTDAVRQEDIATRQKFHDTYVEFLDTHNVAYELIGGTLPERITRVNFIIEEALK